MDDTRDYADTLMRSCLIGNHFDFDRPDILSAWLAFQQFLAHPLPGVSTKTVGLICNHSSDRDDVLWLGFMRSVEDPSGNGWNCGCLLSISVSQNLWDVGESFWWWEERGTLRKWLEDVEAMSAFRKCLTMSGWRWEGFSN